MTRTVLCSAVFLVLVSGGVARAVDVVKVIVGTKEIVQKGKIIRDDVKGVGLEITMGGHRGLTEFPRNRIREVTYDCLQAGYAVGVQQLERGEYLRAIISFDRAREDSSVQRNKWAMQYVLCGLAQANEKIGRKENLQSAVENWEKLKNLIPGGKTRFIREATEGLLRGYVRLGEWEKASSCLGVLEGMGDDGKLMAAVFRAQLSERRKMYSKAVEAYKGVVSSRNPEPSAEVRAKALAGVARCSLGPKTKNWAAALSASKKILSLKGDVPEDALAVAHQVTGEAMLRTMTTQANALDGPANKAKREKIHDGMLEMLRPVVQYKKSEWARQRALYYVGFWSEVLNRAGEGPKWNRRAAAMYRTVAGSYPGTTWAGKATARLDKMGVR